MHYVSGMGRACVCRLRCTAMPLALNECCCSRRLAKKITISSGCFFRNGETLFYDICIDTCTAPAYIFCAKATLSRAGGAAGIVKIGLFGGTFNPVHLGHLRAAEEIREQLGLGKIIFIPAHMPPHKKDAIISARHRFEMVRIAAADNPFFEVSDSGRGIPEGELDRVMEDFHQVLEPDGAKPVGTGLGLPISRRMAEALDGELTVTSAIGEGSTFRLRIPRVHAEARREASAT
mgnify:CR=1 FL=1